MPAGLTGNLGSREASLETGEAIRNVGRVDIRAYALGFLALCILVGFAAIIAVCRANRDDLPAIVRALMRLGMRDDDEWNNRHLELLSRAYSNSVS